MSGDMGEYLIPAQPVPFRYPLRHFADRLKSGGAIKVVAIGSSTTAGKGAVVPYPHRLESATARQLFGALYRCPEPRQGRRGSSGRGPAF